MTDLTLDRKFDLVLNYMANHRVTAVDALFPDAAADYREEWLKRDVMKFWAHLDLGNRRRLIDLAIEHYGYGA